MSELGLQSNHSADRPSLENRLNRPVMIIMACLAVVYLIGVCLTSLKSYDYFWHLRIGVDWLFHHQSPLKDRYSFTAYGHPVIHLPLIFEAIIAVLYQLFDHPWAVRLSKLLFLLPPLAMFLFWQWRTRLALSVSVFCLALLLYALTKRVLIRPEMFSYAMILGFSWWITHRVRQNQRVDWRFIFIAVPVLLFWQHGHATVLLGHAITAFYVLDRVIKKFLDFKFDREWGLILASGPLFYSIQSINPWGDNLIRSFFGPSGEAFKNNIIEYQSLSLGRIDLMLAMALIVAILAMVGYFAKKSFFQPLVLTFFWGLSFHLEKTIPLSLLATLPIVADFLRSIHRREQIVPVLLTGLIAIQFWVLQSHPFLSFDKEDIGFNPLLYPVELIDELKAREVFQVLNEYQTGGFIIDQTAGAVKVFIDGRLRILYPKEFYEQYLETTREQDTLLEVMSRYSLHYLIASHANSPEPLLNTAMETGQFEFILSGERYSLLKRVEGSLHPLSKFIAQPECLYQYSNKTLEEVLSSTSKHPQDVWITRYKKQLEFWIAQNRKLPEPQDLQIYQFEPLVRLYAVSLYRNGDYAGARRVLSRIKRPSPRDIIYMGYSSLHLNELDQAFEAIKGLPAQGNPQWAKVAAVDIIEEIEGRKKIQLANPEWKKAILGGLSDQDRKQISVELGVRCQEEQPEPEHKK